MKAIILTELEDVEVPISYLSGRYTLYSQDFISVENLLAHDERFLTDVVGSFITTPTTKLQLKVSNIDITSEFVRNPNTAELIPLWYTQVLIRPVTSSSIVRKTVSLSYTTSGDKIVEIPNIIDKPSQYIDTNNMDFFIDGQKQRSGSFFVDHGRGIFFADLSSLADDTYNLNFTYYLIEVSINVSPNNGFYSVRVEKHDDELFVVRLLFSHGTGGDISYQSEGRTFEELIQSRILYNQVSSSLVVQDTFTYGLTNTIIFPSDRDYQIFAVRPKNVDSPTILTPITPKGIGVTAPWFIRLEGRSIEEIDIKEIPDTKEREESKKEIGKVVNNRQITISGRDVKITKTAAGISGVVVYVDGFSDSVIPVETYDPIHGIISLKGDIPLEARVIVEYTEKVEWVDYTFIQLNPSLEEDSSSLRDNFILLYIDPDSTNALRSIYHILLPKFDFKEVKTYKFEDLDNAVKAIAVNGIPLAIITLVEPVDADYFDIFDIRTRGGYSGDYKFTTDKALWDGEDVDISGVLIANIPSKVIDDLEEKIDLWEGSGIGNRDKAISLINTKIERYKRLGMKVFTEYK